MFLDVLPFQPPLHKGDVIDGVRIVSDAVNVGGFGRVYRAVGCMDNPSVQYAVKEFCVTFKDIYDEGAPVGQYTRMRDYHNLRQLTERFFTEAKLLHLVGCDESCGRHVPRIDGLPHNRSHRLYYVMEYVEGPTVREEIRNHGKMEQMRVVALIKQVGAVVKRAHNMGLMHGDISPNNIILRNGCDDAVLIDFGNARSYDDALALASMTDDVRSGFNPYQEALDRVSQPLDESDEFPDETIGIGTPAYVAPELYLTKPRRDVYSLAATMYFMLTGKNPVYGNKRMKESLELNHVSKPIIGAIMHALDCSRDSRNLDMSAFMQELERPISADNQSKSVL